MPSTENTPTNEAPPRLLFLCAGDPDSDRAFSGSAKGLATALEGAGVIHHKANVLGLTDPFNTKPAVWLRAARKFDRFGIERRYRFSDRCIRRNSERAHAIAKQHPGYDACFMYGTSFAPLFDVPTYCYFDATVAQVAAEGAWDFGKIGAQAIARGRRHQESVFERCTGIFPRTAYAAGSVINDSGVPSSKVLAAGAGANFQGEPLPHAPYDRQNILFVGVEFERKGGPLLVEAFRRVRRELPNATLTIVGCSPDIQVDGVHVIGRISKAEPDGLHRLLELYRNASVFCIMSHFEPFGIVSLEAQLCGVPCVLPRRFAFPEMIREGETGRLVEEYNADELASVLTSMLGDAPALARMGAAAERFVRDEWTWNRAAERIIRRVQNDLLRLTGAPTA